jgi:hypothetical protein
VRGDAGCRSWLTCAGVVSRFGGSEVLGKRNHMTGFVLVLGIGRARGRVENVAIVTNAIEV